MECLGFFSFGANPLLHYRGGGRQTEEGRGGGTREEEGGGGREGGFCHCGMCGVGGVAASMARGVASNAPPPTRFNEGKNIQLTPFLL